jgi:malate dehydrogenase
MYVGVPVVIGANGVEKVVEIELKGEEQAKFTHSVNSVRDLIAACQGIDTSLAA